MAKRVTNLPSTPKSQTYFEDRKNYSNEPYRPEDSKFRRWTQKGNTTTGRSANKESPAQPITLPIANTTPATSSRGSGWIITIITIIVVRVILGIINSSNNTPSIPSTPQIQTPIPTQQTNIQQYLR